MPSAKGGKVPMTPKLYEEVATKLADVWGDYAGWAQSVGDATAESVGFTDTHPRFCSLRTSSLSRGMVRKNSHQSTVPDS